MEKTRDWESEENITSNELKNQKQEKFVNSPVIRKVSPKSARRPWEIGFEKKIPLIFSSYLLMFTCDCLTLDVYQRCELLTHWVSISYACLSAS